MKREKKLIAFDMDGTLLEGRTIQVLAEKHGFTEDLAKIQKDSNLKGYQKSEKIAVLLKGIHQDEIVKAVSGIKIIKNWRETIEELKQQEHVLGIISDSYKVACDYLAKKMGLDFAIANKLDVDRKRVLTGEISMPLGWQKIGCACKISVCKRYHLEKMSEKFKIPLSNTVVVGDTISDLCMIERAGIGIAMMPKDEILEEKSDIVVRTHDLRKIIPVIL
ncbi:MAG TPA: HAD-IB family phosphatase [Candidatus Nitrosotalea sp.]|nr:HAD-IB family phosphatase [Candidatus Nitrosotalea sp.]